ncbi:MAG: hypothetical protein IID40_08785 [Planctomycetes bacterium]|nr:hypothetical protein [Planctomycetota bacterium]
MILGRFGWMVALAVLMGNVGLAKGQKESSAGHVEGYDVPGLIDQAVNNISHRYNLNSKQHEFTRRMMAREVNAFLREHQDAIYPLIRDLGRAGLDPNNLTAEQRKRIGQAAQPLVEAAKKKILENNAKWREILSEDQKRLHDWDLEAMEGQFEDIDKGMKEMGQGKAVDNPLFPQPRMKTAPPKTPRKPRESRTRIPDEPAVVDDPDGVFARAVEKLIKDYDLDSGQAGAARSIGGEYKGYADVYQKAHQGEFDALRAKQEQARKAGDLEQAREAEAAEEKLNTRIRQWLEEMKGRLMSIPRAAQKAAYDSKHGRSGAKKSSNDAVKKPAAESQEQAKAKAKTKTNTKPTGDGKG